MDAPEELRQATAAGETHELKTWPEFFTAVETGAKTFEVRFDDRGMEAGDTLVLREWDPSVCCYTGKSLTLRVTYRLVLADAPGLRWVGAAGKAGEPGEWVVLGLSVPAIADALARDAKVAEIVAKVEGRVKDRAQAEARAYAENRYGPGSVVWNDDRAIAQLILSVPVVRDALALAATHEAEMLRLIDERDEAQEWADRLAAVAGGPEAIGEHSNANNPWANALELLQGEQG